MPPTAAELWPQIAVLVLALTATLVLVALLLNIHKLLSRVTSIRKDLHEAQQHSAQAQLVEAVAQLQGIAASLDRLAVRCDAIDQKVAAVAARAPREGGAESGPGISAIREDLAALRGPLAEIRDLLGRTETERLGDEVRRCLHTRGFDKVQILTDLGGVPKGGESRVQVEVVKEGIQSKGWVLLRDGAAVEAKISPTLEMFP